MRWQLLWEVVGQTAKLDFETLDLPPGRLALVVIQFQGCRPGQPPLPGRVAYPQMLPAPLQLVKLQLHGKAECRASRAPGSISRDQVARLPPTPLPLPNLLQRLPADR
jgi:hypothetical protein